MLLVTSNAQSELSALERGLHALAATTGDAPAYPDAKAYAEAVGRPHATVQQELRAARVASICNCISAADLQPYARHLAEIHAAPRWVGRALVGGTVARRGRWCVLWGNDMTCSARRVTLAGLLSS